jgi:hypothetical protein
LERVIKRVYLRRRGQPMRTSGKSQNTLNGQNQLFGLDFHHFVEKEKQSTIWELASEFGLSFREVKSLKRKIGRS